MFETQPEDSVVINSNKKLKALGNDNKHAKMVLSVRILDWAFRLWWSHVSALQMQFPVYVGEVVFQTLNAPVLAWEAMYLQLCSHFHRQTLDGSICFLDSHVHGCGRPTPAPSWTTSVDLCWFPATNNSWSIFQKAITNSAIKMELKRGLRYWRLNVDRANLR